MIKKTVKYFWSVRKQLARFLAIGLSSLILDVASLIFLKETIGLRQFGQWWLIRFWLLVLFF